MNNSSIQCNIHQVSFTAMNVIKQKINQEASVCLKTKYAEELNDNVAFLIDCQSYNEQKTDCQNCQMIAKINLKTASLIIRAKALWE